MDQELSSRIAETLRYIGVPSNIQQIRERGNIAAPPIVVECALRLMQESGLVAPYRDEWRLISRPHKKGSKQPVNNKPKRKPGRPRKSKENIPLPAIAQGLTAKGEGRKPLATADENTPPSNQNSSSTQKPDEPAITCIEDAERAADEQREQQGETVDIVSDIRDLDDALGRLESTIRHPTIIPDLDNAGVKLAMLQRFAALFEDSIAAECAELANWIQEVIEIDANVRELLSDEGAA